MSQSSSDESIFKGDFYEAEQEVDMNVFRAEDEDYYFQIAENLEDDRQFILIIYDIVDNKRRVKFAKLLEGYGTRVQKSAFEAMLSQKSYEKLVREIPRYINSASGEDSVRIYRMIGKGRVQSWGDGPKQQEEIILV